MWTRFHQRYALLADSSAFFMSNLGNSLIGMIFWIVAGRFVVAEFVGISSSIISTIYLIGNIGLLGLNFALVVTLPKLETKKQRNVLINKSIIVVSFTAAIVGLIYIFVPLFPGKPEAFVTNKIFIGAFTLFCALWGTHLLLDQVLITLKSGDLTVQKNWVFSISRILILVSIIWLFEQKYAILAATGWTTAVFRLLCAVNKPFR